MAYEPFVGYGTRKAIAYELDQYGVIKPVDTTAYYGLPIYGVRNLNMTYPQARIIPHFDGDKVGLTQVFPPNQPASGTLVVDGADLNLQSILSGVIKRTISGIELMPMLTDQQGNEPAIGLLVYQAGKKTTGAEGYHLQMIPSTKAVPRGGPLSENNYETTYDLSPSATTRFLFGLGLTDNDDGALAAGITDGFAFNKPWIVAFGGDGSEDTFPFDTDKQAFDNTYKVYQSVAGVVTEVTTGLTKATTGLTFAYPVADGTTTLAIYIGA